ncbi:M23 family metallopeptidase [Lapillicoccus sp.]|uniref:M23 family metallopeptidase n=1 Tax=Lapillicoccus sp. TaxID=1909287 RepID=UPI003983C021
MRTIRRQGRASLLRARLTAAGLVLVSTAALGISTSATSSADTGDEKKQKDQEVVQMQDALEGTSTELVQAYQAWQATAAKVPAAQADLAQAQTAETGATQHNNDVAAKLAVAQANQARAVEAMATTRKQLEDTQATLDNFAADMFQGGGGSQLSVALGATSADDFATRVVLADTVSSLTTAALHDLQTSRAEGSAQQAYLTAVSAEILDLKQQAEAALSRAAAARAAAVRAKAELDALVAQQAAHAQQVEAKKVEEQARLVAAQAEQAQLQALLVEQARKAAAAEAARAAAAAAARQVYSPPTGGSGFLSQPANAPITSEFGQRFHPILLIMKLHTGTDFGVPCGTPVFATADGTVISAGPGGGDGNRVVIDHGIVSGVDLVTTYNHLSSFAVTGGAVKRGQLIAYSGNTGYSTGCHLHFETLENGTFVNPRKWI